MSDPFSIDHGDWMEGSAGPNQASGFSDEIVVAFLVVSGLTIVASWLLLRGKGKMAKFTAEQRARFVMFMGIAILAILFIFGRDLQQNLNYRDRWILSDGWMHALGAALLLFGAWKWLNIKEGRRDTQGEDSQ